MALPRVVPLSRECYTLRAHEGVWVFRLGPPIGGDSLWACSLARHGEPSSPPGEDLVQTRGTRNGGGGACLRPALSKGPGCVACCPGAPASPQARCGMTMKIAPGARETGRGGARTVFRAWLVWSTTGKQGVVVVDRVTVLPVTGGGAPPCSTARQRAPPSSVPLPVANLRPLTARVGRARPSSSH